MRLTSGRRLVPSDAMVAGWSAPGSARKASGRLVQVVASARRPAFVVVGVAVLGLAVLLGASRLDPRAASVGSRLSAAKRQVISSAYGRLPLAFEQNRGQSDRRVEFLSRGAGYALALTARGPVLSLARRSAHSRHGSTAALAMRFVGGSTRPRVVASGRLAGEVNYLIGNDRRRWHTGVPTYSGVTYDGVWRGINATFYGNQHRLEYDFRVRPGADSRRIVLDFSGARSLRLDHGGNLVIGVHGASVTEFAPRAYQAMDGRRRPVRSRYVLMLGGRVGVRVGAYDRHRALVIDPALAYSTYVGGSDLDSAMGIAVDATGSAYVTGYTFGPNFPITPGAAHTTYASSCSNAFVTKLSPSGSSLVYSTYLGGSSGCDWTNGIAIDATGSAYVTGQTSSTDFPVTPSAFQKALNGSWDSFVTRLNPAGSAVTYSTYLGGSGDANAFEYGYGIAVGANGTAYVTGHTTSTDFPVTPGAFQTTYGGGPYDAFVAKFDTQASGPASLVYATYLGGSGDDYGYGIAVDATGNAYVTGATASTDFPVTPGAAQPTYGGGPYDVFVVKLNPAGSALTYATYLGGSGSDGRIKGLDTAIAIDSTGSAYVTGATSSLDFPTTARAFQTTWQGGSSDAFVAKLNPGGTRFVYSTDLGGGGDDHGTGIAVDSSGAAYVAGWTSSANFPITAGASQPTNGGGLWDTFIVKLNYDGSALVYSTYLGGSGADGQLGGIGPGIAIDSSGDAYVTGTTTSTDYPTTPGAFQTAFGGGGYDGFVAKTPTPVLLRATSSQVSCSPASAAVGGATNCTATVIDTGSGVGSAPSGTVSLTSSQSGTFGSGASCTLAPSGTAVRASCNVSYTPSAVGPGSHTISAAYGGDAIHAASAGTATLTVSPPSGGGSGPPPNTSAPVLSGVSLTHSVFRVGARATARSAATGRKRGSAPVGTTFRFTLSKRAVVSIVIAQRTTGRRSGRKCVADRRSLRRRPRCTRVITRGTLTRSAAAGASSVAFSGRIGTRALKVGRYQATLTATDAAGRSRSRVVYFSVVRR